MGHKRLDSPQKDKKTQIEGNNTHRSSSRMKCSYILSSFFKYKLSSLFYLFFFSQWFPPISHEGSFLYIVIFLFNPNLSSVDCISDLLDAYPIRALLEPLCVIARLNITAQASFPHKCGQLVSCKTFNVVVATFFLDISWFTVNSFIWNLSLEEWYPLAWYSLSNRAPIPPQRFPRKFGSLGDNLCSSLLVLILVPFLYKLILLFNHPRATLHPRA